MPKKFKDYYDKDCAKLLSEKIVPFWSEFRSQEYINYIDAQVEDKEFLARQDVFVAAFDKFLTGDYTKEIQIFHQILGPELEQSEGMFTHGWWLWPVGRYVETHGVKDWQVSIDFIYELTKRFTGEFAIRPLLRDKPEDTLKQMIKWSKDPNVHVRRLASEGVRISLPWSSKLTLAVDHFNLYRQILDNLKAVPEKFVQKSVGNNLNDLMKVDSDKAKQIIDDWRQVGTSKETDWIIKHGSRSLRRASG